MTRKLPWNRSEGFLTSTPKSAKPTPVRQQKIKRDDSEQPDVDDKELAASSASAKRVKTSHSESVSATSNRITRPGSTSPPPEPLPESYMIEGLEHDDLFRMVEDEFLSTAQQFTAHLHAAEYHRLKAVSKSQNANTIKNISRPVVGRMTDLVKIKEERRVRLAKQKAATRKALANKGRNGDHSDSEDDAWRSASLYGLMESPRKKAARLDNLTKVATATRAAAGFDGAKSRPLFTTPRPIPKHIPGSKLVTKPTPSDADETEDDDGDLDASIHRIHAIPNRPAPPYTPQLLKPRQAQSITRDSQSLRHPVNVVHPAKQNTESETTKEVGSSDDSGGDFLSRLKRRQEDRDRAREQRKLAAGKAQPKQATKDIIPGFL
ncbi:hypothetical protein F4677DRAFT_225806 [Hypoxylon crocopeplum]|nr:hypothetical protein F4677DRAFT_225806 [Hypoxylon crocopeplum]